jgi:hypothetical protein
MTDFVLNTLLGGRTVEQVLAAALQSLQARAGEGKPAPELKSVTERNFVHGPMRASDATANHSR